MALAAAFILDVDKCAISPVAGLLIDPSIEFAERGADQGRASGFPQAGQLVGGLQQMRIDGYLYGFHRRLPNMDGGPHYNPHQHAAADICPAGGGRMGLAGRRTHCAIRKSFAPQLKYRLYSSMATALLNRCRASEFH
jgi:hypothetical protein